MIDACLARVDLVLAAGVLFRELGEEINERVGVEPNLVLICLSIRRP